MSRRTWEGKERLWHDSSSQSLVVREDGAFVAFLDGKGSPAISWISPLGWDWPLQVGKSWKRSSVVTTHANNEQTAVKTTFAVEAHEEITVPAGTFKTVRLRVTDNLGVDNVLWFAPELGIFARQLERRTRVHPAGAGQRNSVLKAFVRGR